MREVRLEGTETESDGTERSDGCGEVFARVSDEARRLKGDVLQEEPGFVISLTERFKFLETFAEVERDGGWWKDGINSDSGD